MLAHPKQKFQDWFTQQWAIFWGKQIEPGAALWLMGPFGNVGAIADDFVNKIAKDEGLIIERNASAGLISSVKELKLPDKEFTRLFPEVINFYEQTSNYRLTLSVKWNPFFRTFGKLVNYLFSNRIEQLNIPTNNRENAKGINSEIISLSDPVSKKIKYIVWYRTYVTTGQVLYSGVYSTCVLPSGKACIKAVFPLPNGNATVIMSPSVSSNGELRLESSGKKFGDPGFYFLLNDARGNTWSQYISSFRDQLNVSYHNRNIIATQTLTLWCWRVVEFNYTIHRK